MNKLNGINFAVKDGKCNEERIKNKDLRNGEEKNDYQPLTYKR